MDSARQMTALAGEEKKSFYLTFGQNHPLLNSWILVLADSQDTARELVNSTFGQKWSGLYAEENFDRSFFPAGQVGMVLS